MAQAFREMTNQFHGKVFYSSTFFPKTGTLVRVCEDREDDSNRYDGYVRHLFRDLEKGNRAEHWKLIQEYEEEWREKFDWGRKSAFSPVPETIDVAINTWCNFGCTYCYTDATTKGQHASPDLIEAILTGLDQPPYQMALGGGSPTQHPQFVEILELIRMAGSVPNYTTEGQNLTDKILGATNELCGGVALTYHAARGLQLFKDNYLKLRKHLKIQLNVHIIADKDVVTHLDQMTGLVSECGPMNLVLLAYYPDVGRSNLMGLMPKKVYMTEFPAAIQRAMAAGHQIAFSEGLIPYFLSRPEIGVDTRFLTPSEGRFSCYVDVNGCVTHSSFQPPSERWSEDLKNKHNIFKVRMQELWNKLSLYHSEASGANCDDCAFLNNCTTPIDHHYFVCKYASHNQPELQPKNAKWHKDQAFWSQIYEGDES